MNKNLEFNLPQNAYVNFDALSLRSFMIDKLNAEGNFTDQNYEGSNMSSLLDILAYYTHVLLFYLNQTSTESMFSQSNIYENMNKIVKLIGYKPTGKQTSSTSINCNATQDLSVGSYNIRKYSYFLIDNIQYTFIEDNAFEKTTNSEETITSLNENVILHQGVVGEYPIYVADGNSYETMTIVVDNLTNNRDTRFISNGTISVYVKEQSSGTWSEYREVDSLFLSENTDRVYDLRLNENGHYEVKFGNGVFGRQIESGDEVAVYYILSDGEKGQISKNSINGNKLFLYNSARFSQIYSDITISDSKIITNVESSYLIFNNPTNSTLIQDAESVEQIRENSPIFLSTQLRLVTENDYEKFLLKTIPNILKDVKVVNNKTYIDEYIKYFYDICVDPNKVNRVILNNVNFADSCDFNNINIFCVPTLTLNTDEQYPEFLSNNFKTLVKDLTLDKKIISNEIVPRDPIYMALDFGYDVGDVSEDIYKKTKLIVVRNLDDKTNKESIKSRISEIILEYFNNTNIKLGQKIDMTQLTSNILSSKGVKSIKTLNTENGTFIDGLSLVIWNPMFKGADVSLITQTKTLEFFKYPYIYRPNTLVNRIEVVDE